MDRDNSNQSPLYRKAATVLFTIIGLPFLLIGLFILFWNEQRAGNRDQRITNRYENLVTISPYEVDSTVDQQYVHLIVPLNVQDSIHDSTFQYTFKGLCLEKKVYTYQWVEYFYGGTTPPNQPDIIIADNGFYQYVKEWKEKIINSDSFYVNQITSNSKYINPDTLLTSPVNWKTNLNRGVQVGPYLLDPEPLKKLVKRRAQPLPVASRITVEHPLFLRTDENMIKFNQSKDSLTVGDTEVEFFGIPNGTVVSLVAEKNGKYLGYHPDNTMGWNSYTDLVMGRKSKEDFTEDEVAEASAVNDSLKWVSVVLFFFAAILLRYPISHKPRVLPFFAYLFRTRFLFIIVAPIIGFLVLSGLAKLVFWTSPVLGIIFLGGGLLVNWLIQRSVKME
jgi:hypothetical protein